MKIESITIKNFKNFQNAEATNLPDLAVFIGKNGSGKTSFLNFTLSQEYFNTGERTLIILCEEGEVELDAERIRKMKADVVTVESESELNEEFLMVMDAKYSPDRVLIEYNGMWNPQTIMNIKTPSDWVLYQGITTIDASTFNVYLNNMKPLIAKWFADTLKDDLGEDLSRNIIVFDEYFLPSSYSTVFCFRITTGP